jgi:uncharacterized phage protein (predicted DNA packaging)
LELAELKLYLKKDEDDENELILGLHLAAELYLINAGVIVNNSELYGIAIKLLVGHWYDNRSIIGKTDKKIAFSLDSIITQLKYADIEYNEAVISLIKVALSFDIDPVISINKAKDILIQAGGIV